MKVVLTRAVPEAGLERLRSAYDVHVHDFGNTATEENLIAVARDADALLTLLSDPVTARVFAACPSLRIVAQYAVGYENIDLHAAREHGVIVTNTPGVLTDATADFAFALLLAVARRVISADRYVREGRFSRWETDLLLGTDLRGKTLGIIGLGRIGEAMARRAIGFGMEIVYYNRRPANPTIERLLSAEWLPLDELLEVSDVVSLHCALNSESRMILDAAALGRMKSTAIVINTARGAVLDEAALVEALRSGRLAGAGLDVFEREPEVHAGLMEQENVVLAPHLGSATREARSKMAMMCSEAIEAALSGAETVPYRVA